jgi:hypothetical protein
MECEIYRIWQLRYESCSEQATRIAMVQSQTQGKLPVLVSVLACEKHFQQLTQKKSGTKE